MFAAARSIKISALTKRVAKRDVSARAEGESAPAPVAVRETTRDAGDADLDRRTRARDGARGRVPGGGDAWREFCSVWFRDDGRVGDVARRRAGSEGDRGDTLIGAYLSDMANGRGLVL